MAEWSALPTMYHMVPGTNIAGCVIQHMTVQVGLAKVSCIVRHQGVQLRSAYNLARPAILVAGKGRGGMF